MCMCACDVCSVCGMCMCACDVCSVCGMCDVRIYVCVHVMCVCVYMCVCVCVQFFLTTVLCVRLHSQGGLHISSLPIVSVASC